MCIAVVVLVWKRHKEGDIQRVCESRTGVVQQHGQRAFNSVACRWQVLLLAPNCSASFTAGEHLYFVNSVVR